MWDSRTISQCSTVSSNPNQPGYRFADPLWNKNNMNVSLLIASTKVANEGDYTVEVMTDSGNAEGRTKLQVTAKYNNPSISLIKESDTPNSDKALVCKAQGGYPAGRLGWFDETKTEWTKSAKLEVKKMDTGLFELTSKLPLLTGSTFSMYICAVYNSSEGKECESSFALAVRDDGEHGAGSSRIIAPVVVIGSLIVGLLLAL
ncbi:T-lymphocyte activation antigen CD80, partial [Nematolebias whitei]|uniref:T-lymphocyte activation antigen CD80 n=1 Tax=Nematolebias whitei TaxID=451745 RepID=UPI00189B3A6C